MTYKVSYQDFSKWREVMHTPVPDVKVEIFDDKDAADHRKKELQYLGMTACVTEVVTRRGTKRRTPLASGESHFNKDWKIAR